MIEENCPCGSGLTYAECCRPFHVGAALAPTAERLMRSRYTAFVKRDAKYLMRTWDHLNRPSTLEFEDDLEWVGLTILGRTKGGLFDDVGTVEYVARYRSGGERGRQQENSAFIRSGKAWLYAGAA